MVLIYIILSAVIRSCGHNGSHWYHTLSCHQKLWSQRFSFISYSQLSIRSWGHNSFSLTSDTLSCQSEPMWSQRFSLISDTLSCHQKLGSQRFSLTSYSQLSSEAVVTTVLIDITLSAVIRSCGHNGSHWYHTLSCHQKLRSQRFSLISHSQLSSEAVVTTVLIDIILSAVIWSRGHNGSHWYHSLSFHQKLWLQRFSLLSHSQLSSEAVVTTVLIDITLSAVIWSYGFNGFQLHHSFSCHLKLWSQRFSVTSYSQLSSEAGVTTFFIDIILSAVIWSCGDNASHWYHTLSCHQKLWSQRFSLISYSQLSSEAVVTTVLIDITLSAVIRSCGHNGSHWYHTFSCHQKLWSQRFSFISYSQLSSEAGVTTFFIDIILSAVIRRCGHNGSHWYHTLSCHQKLGSQRFSLTSYSQLSSEAVVTTVLIDITLSAVIRSCGHNGSHWYHTLSCHQKLRSQRFSLISHSQLSSEAVVTTVLIDIILSAVIWSRGHNGSHWYHSLSFHQKLWLQRFSLLSHSQLSSEAVVTTVLIDITLSAVIWSYGFNGFQLHHSFSCHLKLWSQRFSVTSYSQLSSEAGVTTFFIDIILSAVIWSCGDNASHWYHTLSCHQKLWSQRFSLISYSQLSSEAVVTTVLIDITLSAVIRSCGHNGSHWYHTFSCHLKLWFQRFSVTSLSQLSSEAVVTTILGDSQWLHTLSCHLKLGSQRFSLTSYSQLSSEAMVTTLLIDISLSAVIRSCGHNGSHWYHTLSCHQKLWLQRFIDIILSAVIWSCCYNGSHWYHTLSCHQKLWSQRFSLISYSQLLSEAVVTTVLIDITLSAVTRSCGHYGSHWHHTLSCHQKLRSQRFSLISHSQLSSEAVVTTVLINIILSAVIRSCGHNDSHWYHTLSCHQKLWLQRFSLISHSQ